MEGKRFRISNNKLTAFGCTAVLGTLLLGYLIPKILGEDFNDNPFKFILIALGISVVLGIIFAIIAKESYFTVLKDGFEIATGKKVTTYTNADFLGSNVVKHYTNGIYTGTTRELKIKDGTKTKEISCSHLSRSAFENLVAFLGKKEFEENHDSQVTAGYFDTERFFKVPNNSILKANKLKFFYYDFLDASFLIVGIVLLIAWLVTGRDSSVFVLFGSLCLMLAVVIFFAFTLPVIKTYKGVKTIPDHVSFDNNTLAVGPDTYTVDKVTGISMVPGKYQILNRDFVVVTNDGVKHKYSFGRYNPNKEKSKLTYTEYPDLYMTAKLWCLSNNINFQSMLG